MNEIKKIEMILKSDAGLSIEEQVQPTYTKVIDNRFLLIKKIVDSLKNKSDIFYAELIKIISKYIDQLYNNKVYESPLTVFDKKGNIILQNHNELYSNNTFILTNANQEFSETLFRYVCDILEKHIDIKLDLETLNKLINRNSKLLSLSKKESYLFCPFDFERLSKIISNNQTLEKSNISIDEIYQILLDTFQINNEDVFGNLVKPEQYNMNHQKIDEILLSCNAKTFIDIARIIIKRFDKNFDIINIVKKRNNNKFCEQLIFELLNSQCDINNFDLIHQILTSSDIEIDYDFYSVDIIGQANLKSIIALSGNKMIINDLLSKEQNTQNYYSHGVYGIQLYTLYAVTGEYEKALTTFEKNYNFNHDLNNKECNFDNYGFAYGNWAYVDSLAGFIKELCNSFKKNNIDYSIVINIINRVINNENVKYINLVDTIKPIREVFSPDDFKLLIDSLLEKHKFGELDFIIVNECDGIFDRYIINIAGEDEIKNQLNELMKNKVYTKKDDIKY